MGPQDYDFTLPPEQIAHAPAPERTASRMLVLGAGVEHRHVRDLPDLLPPDALVVVNTSKVVPARLHGTRDDGRRFEVLLCAPAPGQGPGTRVTAWVRNAKKLQPGQRLAFRDALELAFVGRDALDPRARVFEVTAGDVLAACEAGGEIPLPPYIARPDGPHREDEERYQTVFAAAEGSVAAPTAGLHLDAAMVERLDPARVTLHVGPGTFLPMEADDVRDHRVGAERYAIEAHDAARIQAARDAGRPIVAVGTTATRTLETLGRDGRRIEAGAGETDLMITPGHRFEVVTHLLTNFHLPRSSLLMLVCCLGGRERVLAAYEEAVAQGYRFYSYGDCMLVGPAQS
ncbi:MAG: tRNA preQ1(34) S-adenosylmethionine ribosyltransferase-isomerase QueA [Nannocystaceae bacterium]|nr:tRNA preQ1(34) S-adenosylmethionine ribosyltransferase-isomerase QueA [bacterium]